MVDYETKEDLWYWCWKCIRFHKNPDSKIYLEHLKYQDEKYAKLFEEVN